LKYIIATMTQRITQPTGLRSVRTFVKRTGRMTVAQSRALDDLWPRYGIDYSEEVMDLDRVFGRSAARVIEIGFGNGDSLVEQAVAHPLLDYMGIEVHDPGAGHCLLQASRNSVENLRIVIHDALDVLTQQIPDNSISRINLYFPDPWPKKRHHKRRMVQPEFLQLAAQKLLTPGSLHIATDWENYAVHIDEILASNSLFQISERRVHDGENALDRPMTKFEKRGMGRGHRIWDWKLVKNSF
jgi:tRNA (guanine-N7-)-methyltransferase